MSMSILLVAVFTFQQVSAQRFMAPGRVLGWADDNNYLERVQDAEGKQVVMSVNVKTGKKKEYTQYKDARTELSNSLPEGFTMGMGAATSSDFNSVVIVKDNDLWYFKMGDAGARQLTKDEDQELNPRFSSDGKHIAYTKNRDLYVFSIDENAEKRLTFDATDKIYNGYASWVYFEEILG